MISHLHCAQTASSVFLAFWCVLEIPLSTEPTVRVFRDLKSVGSVDNCISKNKRTKMLKTHLPQFARNANAISQGLAWTALERCEDGE